MHRLGVGLLGLTAVVAAAAQTSISDLNRLGNQALDRGDYVGAEPLYREAVQKFRALGPEYEAHLAASLFNLGVALNGEGKRADGAKAYEEALALHRHSLGPKHLRTLTNINHLGSAYLMMGDPVRAESLFAEALPVERELYPGDIQLARTLAGMASARLRDGKVREAAPLAEEALAIAVKAAGEDDLETALMYSIVAETHRLSKRPERALPLFRKARAIYEREVGPAHPRAVSLLSQEGLILMAEGKLALAEQSMVRAVEVLNRSCPACSLELSTAEQNLGMLRLTQKRYVDADRLLSHALLLEEKYSIRPGRQMAETLRSLALVREKQRLHEDAARLKSRAAMILSFQ